MFELSFTEFILISLVALAALEPKDVLTLLKAIRDFITSIKTHYEHYTAYLNTVLDEVDDKNKVVDMEGNLQKTYDIAKIMKEIEGE